MRAVDFIASELGRRNLPLWTFPGGTVYPLYDACHKQGVRTIVCRSEFGAGYAAIGAAKVTQSPQVVCATSGPGATNLVTPIAECYYDSVPVVFLTGQVGTSNFARRGVRQPGFQHTPIVDMVSKITKDSRLCMNGDSLADMFAKALEMVISDRRGPVLIDMPMDVQESILYRQRPIVKGWVDAPPPMFQEKLKRVVALIHSSARPLILAGAGCVSGSSSTLLRMLVGCTGIPIVCSLPAVGVLPTNDPHYVGMVGHTGHWAANRMMAECDLLIIIGSRLDIRQTGTETGTLASGKFIVCVNNDGNELAELRVPCEVSIEADCALFLSGLLSLLDPLYYVDSKWGIGHKVWKSIHDSEFARTIAHISEESPEDCIFVTGVGSHQQHAARGLFLDYPKRMFLTSAGHGCMGAGLPMAIGASIATKRPAVLIDGDGSFQMSMHELGTLRDHIAEANVTIHIIRNNSGGIVSQFARLRGWDPWETTWSVPDFERIASAYPPLSLTVHKVNEEGVWPILESGHEIDDMTWFPYGGIHDAKT